jgi:hypothetical protein
MKAIINSNINIQTTIPFGVLKKDMISSLVLSSKNKYLIMPSQNTHIINLPT